MKPMESLLMLYHLLRQCWEIAPGDPSSEGLILADFLGDIDPTLWADGRPMDRAVYGDWLEQTDISRLNRDNIIPAVLNFLAFYENRGFYFGTAKNILQGPTQDAMIANAERFARCMYQAFAYSD